MLKVIASGPSQRLFVLIYISTVVITPSSIWSSNHHEAQKSGNSLVDRHQAATFIGLGWSVCAMAVPLVDRVTRVLAIIPARTFDFALRH